MKQPPTVVPASTPGPSYDPMDGIVQDMENIESFLDRLAMNPRDQRYLESHLPGILHLRHSISMQLEKLADEPYNYPPSRLKALRQENETIFIFLERVVGIINHWDEAAFKKAVKAVEETLLKFDDELTP